MTAQNNVCKRCGYCEHCKRSDMHPYVRPPVIYPQYPYYPYQYPTWTSPYWSTITCQTSTNAVNQVSM